MTKFKVLQRIDAWIDYTAEIEAENALEASEAARADPARFAWTRVGEEEFPSAWFAALDDQNEELPHDGPRSRLTHLPLQPPFAIPQPPAEERCDGTAARLDGLPALETTLANSRRRARDER